VIYRFKDLHDAKNFVQSTRNRDWIVRRKENLVQVVNDRNDVLERILVIHYSGSATNGANQTDNQN